MIFHTHQRLHLALRHHCLRFDCLQALKKRTSQLDTPLPGGISYGAIGRGQFLIGSAPIKTDVRFHSLPLPMKKRLSPSRSTEV